MKTKKLSKEEYLKTHLTDMDEAKKKSYIDRMETYTSEDYEREASNFIELMGEPSEEQQAYARALIKKLYGKKNKNK